MDIKNQKPNAFYLFGWNGYPKEDWAPEVKQYLLEKGFEVFIPNFPNPEKPIYED